MTAEQIQDILNRKDILQALGSARAKNKQELDKLQRKIGLAFKIAVAPPPRPTNTVEMVMSAARNAFQIWQGVSFGLKIVRGFRSACKSK